MWLSYFALMLSHKKATSLFTRSSKIAEKRSFKLLDCFQVVESSTPEFDHVFASGQNFTVSLQVLLVFFVWTDPAS